jgi:hypothetical protein
MDAILDHPANAGIVRSLSRKRGGVVSVVAPDAAHDPYLGCGSHPEIVERVWDQLGRALPSSSRRILCGTPVLVHPETGVVLAVCYGISYCLRLPDGALPAALQAGCETTHRWGDGKVTDLSAEFGANWVFGRWAKDEEQWCRTVAAGSETTV